MAPAGTRIDGFLSKMKPGVFISFLAFPIKVAMEQEKVQFAVQTFRSVIHIGPSDGNRTVPSREVPGRSRDGTGQDRT